MQLFRLISFTLLFLSDVIVIICFSDILLLLFLSFLVSKFIYFIWTFISINIFSRSNRIVEFIYWRKLTSWFKLMTFLCWLRHFCVDFSFFCFIFPNFFSLIFIQRWIKNKIKYFFHYLNDFLWFYKVNKLFINFK